MGRKVAFGAAVAVLLGATAFAALDFWPWPRLGDRPPGPATPRLWVRSDTLHPGESLSDVFGRHGIGAGVLSDLADRLHFDPRRLKAGLILRFAHRDTASVPEHVTIRTAPDEETRLRRADDKWVAERREIRWTPHTVRLEGRIATSLYEAMDGATASESLDGDARVRLAWDLADVFQWSIDFTRDIQPEDRFAVVFERETSERGEARIGRILATEFSVGGRTLTAFRFEPTTDAPQYFDDRGQSLRRAFLKAPVEFRRISSRFSRSRFHPILGIWRRHEGIDYSAGTGTPVMAAGDGTITTAGWSGGYGRLIDVRHQNGISTRYGHLSGFAKGVRSGARVHQGEVIGFVGSTGLATAPHLHYEFRQNGAARDPARVDLGNGEPVATALMAAFTTERDRLRLLLHPAAPIPDHPVAEAPKH